MNCSLPRRSNVHIVANCELFSLNRDIRTLHDLANASHLVSAIALQTRRRRRLRAGTPRARLRHRHPRQASRGDPAEFDKGKQSFFRACVARVRCREGLDVERFGRRRIFGAYTGPEGSATHRIFVWRTTQRSGYLERFEPKLMWPTFPDFPNCNATACAIACNFIRKSPSTRL